MSAYHQMDTCVSVIGLGYVGKELCRALSRYFTVVAYDTNLDVVETLRREYAADTNPNRAVYFTTDPVNLRLASVHFVAVPTPVSTVLDDEAVPDLTFLRKACEQAGKRLKRGDIVVIESTVYPGCTEEVCLPILQTESGLASPADFGVAYSPERINPGDTEHTLETVVKIVAANSPDALNRINAVYNKVCAAGVKVVSSIKVAEASKLVENIQRDVNIALMNELAEVFEGDVDMRETLEACGTKWNFAPFRPGLVGGRCVPVNPYYLMSYAKMRHRNTDLIATARSKNAELPKRIVSKVEAFLRANAHLTPARVIVLGLTYKPGLCDIRNSGAMEITRLLNSLDKRLVAGVEVHDPYVAPDDEYDRESYAVAVMAVPHREYQGDNASWVSELVIRGGMFVDVAGNSVKVKK